MTAAGPNAHCEGTVDAVDPLDPRDTFDSAGQSTRAETESLVALIDRKADLGFATKVWTIGNIFRDADAEERAALLEFVVDNWGPK